MRNYKGYQRILSFLLSFLMAFTSMPITAFATEGIEDSPPLEELVSHYLYIDQQQEFGTIFDTDDEKEYLEIFEETEDELKSSDGEVQVEPKDPVLLYLNTEYNVGDEIKLQVNVEDGYEVAELKVQEWIPEVEVGENESNINAEDIVEPQEVEYAYDEASDILTFIMPEFDVFVSASFVEKASSIDLEDHSNDFCSHNYQANKTEPTCTSEGFTTYVCLDCGDTYTDDKTDKLQHQYDEFITKEATETENGEKTFTCYLCGDTYTEPTPKIGEEFETAAPVGDANPSGEQANVDVYIREFSTQFFYGADKTTRVWTATNSNKDHRFSFRINYAISGIDIAPVNSVTFTIPKSILNLRDGSQGDYYEMSVPSQKEVEAFLSGVGESIDTDVNFTYYEDGDNIVIYNFRELPAGNNGYIELSYLTSNTTFDYEDMGESDDFTCVMTTPQEQREAAPLTVKIDTSAKITSTAKKYPSKLESWNSSWGDAAKPADSTKYHYLQWTIESNVTANQPYNFILDDVVTGNYEGMFVVGYKFAGETEFKASNTATNQDREGKRYDYVLTAIPLDTYQDKTYWEANNVITATVDPVDQVDVDTNATSSKQWTWSKPVFTVPTGHVNVFKFADGAYRANIKNPSTRANKMSFTNSQYTRYDLETFNGYDEADITNTQLDDFKYLTYIVGYPYPWTYDSSYNNPKNPEAYGKLPFKYEMVDEGVQLTNDTTNKSQYSAMLTANDFKFTKLEYSWYMRDAEFNEETQKFSETNVTYTDTDILYFYGKFDFENKWVQIGSYNIKTGAASFDQKYIESMNSSTIVPKSSVNLVAYKVETTNAHYYTEVLIVPHLVLKNSTTVMNYVTGKPSIGILNHCHGKFYNCSGSSTTPNALLTAIEKEDTEYARVSQRYSNLDKNVSSVSNNTRKKTYTISWKITQSEEMEWGENGNRSDIPQEGGIFYDLLPEGATFSKNSVDVQVGKSFLKNSAYSVETIDNYKGTGRTMLIVKIFETANRYTVFYNTIHTWNSITDYGNDVYNPVAYETGNSSITNGYPDNGGKYDAKGKLNPNAIKEYDLMSDLNPETNNNSSKKFIFTEKYYDIAAITAASSGLMKKVKTENDAVYAYEATTSINDSYSYQLRFMNSFTSSSKNLIFFDSLENYNYDGEASEGTLNDGSKSDWHGIFQSVDVNQLVSRGIAPVVYYSTISHLDIEKNSDISDNSVWSVLTSSTDLTTVRAIAVDARKTITGEDFVLAEGESVVVNVFMKAPAECPVTYNDFAYTYNNVYMANTVMSVGNTEPQDFLIHQDYTEVKLIVSSSFGVEKVSEESDGIKIAGIEFKLFGTSNYGTRMNKIVATDGSGRIYFEDLEMGTYTLQEYTTTDDWILDPTEHTVVVNGAGRTLVDGIDCTDSYFKIQNRPRVHGDFSFMKKELGEPTIGVFNTTFKLEGVSDYGTKISIFATSESNGRVTFNDIEMGVYTLVEAVANPNYILNDIIYTVKMDENGAARITSSNEVDVSGNAIELENSQWFQKNENGPDFIFNRYKFHEVTLRKVDSENTSIFLEGATFSLKGVSESGIQVDMEATSNQNGLVSFTDIESGIYVLKEIAAPQGLDEDGNFGGNRNYILDETEYTVKITFDGIISINGLDIEDGTGYFVVENERAYDKAITITKIWEDGLTSEERIAQGIIPELHLTTRDLSKDSNFHTHELNEGEVLKEATCVEKGETTHICLTCGMTVVQKTPALRHEWDDGVITSEPSCTNNGTKVYTCKKCGMIRNETLDMIEHDWSPIGIVTKPATCTESGVIVYLCQTDGCSAERTEIIEILPHEYGDDNTCINCGQPPYLYTNIIMTGEGTATVYASGVDYDFIFEDDWGNYFYYKVITFNPKESGTYTFTGGAFDDTLATLYDSNMEYLLKDDDSWEDCQFQIYYDCEAGEVYYLAVSSYSLGYCDEALEIPVYIEKVY